MMDPYAAYRLMHSASEDSLDKMDSALGLIGWLDRGGFWDPDHVNGVTRETAYEEAEQIVQDSLMDQL